jgi:UrcA family protein
MYADAQTAFVSTGKMRIPKEPIVPHRKDQMNHSHQELSGLRTIIGVSCALAIGASAAFCVLAAHAGEQAAADQDARRVSVHYADLNLTDPAAVKTLYGRLREAARVACGDSATSEIQRMSAYKECFDSALQKSVNTVDNANLYALHVRRVKVG